MPISLLSYPIPFGPLRRPGSARLLPRTWPPVWEHWDPGRHGHRLHHTVPVKRPERAQIQRRQPALFLPNLSHSGPPPCLRRKQLRRKQPRRLPVRCTQTGGRQASRGRRPLCDFPPLMGGARGRGQRSLNSGFSSSNAQPPVPERRPLFPKDFCH
jgi:hypothetical protein